MKESGRTKQRTGSIPWAFLMRTSADRAGQIASDRYVYGVREMPVISKGGRLTRNHISLLMPAKLGKSVFPRIKGNHRK